MGGASQPIGLDITLGDLAATGRLADALASAAQPGLTILLDGPVGAGKTTLARDIIQRCLQKHGLFEDVPSPTFTIVQSYDAGPLSIWHADLYRISDTSELEELGLTTAFEDAFCLVEWPDRLGDIMPPALHVLLSYGDETDARHAKLTSKSPLLTNLDPLREAVNT